MYPYKVAVIFFLFQPKLELLTDISKSLKLKSTDISVTGTKLFHVDRQTDRWTSEMMIIVYCFPFALQTCQTVEGTDRQTQTVTLV
jgi:hypothetical protein